MKKLLFAALYDAVFEGVTEDNLYTETPTAPARERRCLSEPNSRRSVHEVVRHSDGYAFG